MIFRLYYSSSSVRFIVNLQTLPYTLCKSDLRNSKNDLRNSNNMAEKVLSLQVKTVAFQLAMNIISTLMNNRGNYCHIIHRLVGVCFSINALSSRKASGKGTRCLYEHGQDNPLENVRKLPQLINTIF